MKCKEFYTYFFQPKTKNPDKNEPYNTVDLLLDVEKFGSYSAVWKDRRKYYPDDPLEIWTLDIPKAGVLDEVTDLVVKKIAA